MDKQIVPRLFVVLSWVILIFSSCAKKKMDVDMLEINTPTSERLNKVKFFDTKTGFIVGGDQYKKPVMLKTIDGGLSWTEVQLPQQNEQKEIYGFDIYPNGKLITVGYDGTIYISDDSGSTFRYVQHLSWKELRDIAIWDADHASIVGGVGFNMGHLSDFKNDGLAYNQIKESFNFELSDIDFVGDQIGYISGYGVIMKTADVGITWNFTSAKNDFYRAMCWKNTQEGVAVGYEGSILKTNNGGDTWETIRNGNAITRKKIHFLDVDRNRNKMVVAVGECGLVFISNDDGATWREVKSFFDRDIRGVVFIDETTCELVGDQGHVFLLHL